MLKQVGMINRYKPTNQYELSDLEYPVSSQNYLFKTSRRKFRVIHVGLLVLYK